MAIKHIETKSGFICDIDNKVFDDFELIDLIDRADENDVLALHKLLKKILCAEDIERLKDHIRTDDGRVPYEAIGAEITDIMESCAKK